MTKDETAKVLRTVGIAESYINALRNVAYDSLGFSRLCEELAQAKEILQRVCAEFEESK